MEEIELQDKFRDGVWAQRSFEDSTQLPVWTIPSPAVEEILTAAKELFNDELDFVLDSGQIEQMLVFPVRESRESWNVQKVMKRAHARGIPVVVYYPTIDALNASCDQRDLDTVLSQAERDRRQRQLEEHRLAAEDAARRMPRIASRLDHSGHPRLAGWLYRLHRWFRWGMPPWKP